jgi:hypothetical protein
VCEKRIVRLTSKLGYSFQGTQPEDVTDFKSDGCFRSSVDAGEWICWDFGGRHISVTHYTIQSYVNLSHWDIRDQVVKSWVVEGSLDGLNWTGLDGD